MRRALRDHGLSLTLGFLFLLFWACQAVAGHAVFNEDLETHGQAAISLTAYLASGHFWQATGENWESEFLQMGAYVILTAYLFQRGSAESNDPDQADKIAKERQSKPAPWLYRNSLSLAFLGLFLVSFGIHAAGGWKEFNAERVEHGEEPEPFAAFLGDAEFWFQSFQNWQSEFLAVLSIVILSIFLRQNGSPESKKVNDPDSKTGT
ncbi:hypothetical protein OJ996_19890 [Luteolibacter sp. GHJ8]|uniref:Transmembrane protein n=1 Tax=Luteolibacter rhizosphaerae TaxID=2989719 RepID=A0ABT3G7N6_9BACT|nr:DUF6766 family protein [Luteolibacter rhizosphaerae]MCW1915859.1 hypothetical protein [Luteolibacter rhizosphaerae]